MTIAYSSNLGLINITTGTESGLWGNYTNTNICSLIEQAISGYATQAITDGADTTVTISNGATSSGRNAALKLTGALTLARNLIVPTVQKLYYINNATTGGFAVTVKTSAGTGISVPNGKAMALLVDGTNVVDAITYVTGLTISSANPSASLGLTAVNGSATTFMTSDSAPALSQAIVPTWTGAHIWSAAATFNSTATFNSVLTSTSTAGFSGAVTFTSTTNPTINDGASTQYAVGFREIPQVAKTATYTVALSDSGKHVYYTTISTSTAVVIPVNATVAFPIGTVLTFINNGAAGGVLTFAPQGSDTFILAGTGASGSRSLSRYGITTATKIALSGANSTWYFSGTGIS